MAEENFSNLTDELRGGRAPAESASRSLTSIVDALLSSDPAAEADAIKALRVKIAGKDNIDFLQRPLLVKLIDIVREVDQSNGIRRKTQLDAAWILTKVTASSSELTSIIGHEGGIRSFVRHLENESFEEMRVQSVWILGNIAGDSPARRDQVISQGVLPPLLHLISQNTRFKRQDNTTHVMKLHPVRMSVWCLSNLCRVNPGPPPHFASLLPCLPVLARMLQVQDREILRDACFAFASLADGSHEKIQSVINSGVVPRLVILLQHTSKMVVASALRAVGNILLGDDSQTQFVIDNGGLAALLQLLLHDNENLRRDACRATSNVTAGNADQIQAVMDAGIFPILIALMHTPTSVGVDVEAGWAMLNVGRRGRPDQLEALRDMGCDTRIFTLGLPLPLPRPGQRGFSAYNGANPANAVFGQGGLFPLQFNMPGSLQQQHLAAQQLHQQLQQRNPGSNIPPPPPLPPAAYAGLPPPPPSIVETPPPHQQQQQQQQQQEIIDAVQPQSADVVAGAAVNTPAAVAQPPLAGTAAAAAAAMMAAASSSSPNRHRGHILSPQRRRLSASTLSSSSTTSSAAASNVASNVASTASIPPNLAESDSSTEINSLLELDSSATVEMVGEDEVDEGVGDEESASTVDIVEDGTGRNLDELD